jgi:hypothetical protein
MATRLIASILRGLTKCFMFQVTRTSISCKTHNAAWTASSRKRPGITPSATKRRARPCASRVIGNTVHSRSESVVRSFFAQGCFGGPFQFGEDEFRGVKFVRRNFQPFKKGRRRVLFLRRIIGEEKIWRSRFGIKFHFTFTAFVGRHPAKTVSIPPASYGVFLCQPGWRDGPP